MTDSKIVSVSKIIDNLTFLPNRTPETSDDDAANAFATLFDYRDGGIFVAHYAGNSQWERHSKGDEIVYVIEGGTTLYILSDAGETANKMQAGDMIIVPQGLWHRFETPDGVKLMSVTPQPTDHQIEKPEIS